MLLAAQPSLRTLRELVRLFERRLAETAFGRIARFSSVSITALTIAFMVVVRVEDGPSAPTVKLATGAEKWALWLVAAAIALAAAHQRALADRRDGVEMMALARGFDGARLTLVRAAAAFSLSLRWMLLPGLACTLASALSAGTAGVMVSRALVLLAVVGFAIASSLVLGPLGALADGISPKRGRSLLFSALLLSALLAEVAHDPALSITGALLTLYNGLLHAVGAARLL